jgi:hypothetical protein
MRNSTIDLTKDEVKPVAASLPKNVNRGAGAGKVAIKVRLAASSEVDEATGDASAPLYVKVFVLVFSLHCFTGSRYFVCGFVVFCFFVFSLGLNHQVVHRHDVKNKYIKVRS